MADFIEGDEFDPENIQEAELQAENEEARVGDAALALLRKRRRHYMAVFTAGTAPSQEDIDYVMNDLAWFCKAFLPSTDIRDGQHAQMLANIKDGRREVYQRIREFTLLDENVLMLKYYNDN